MLRIGGIGHATGAISVVERVVERRRTKCMYLLFGKGQSAQKRPYWGEDRIKRKIYE